MGVLQRFERRLEGLVEGAFARVFKGEVHPTEIAAALQRETDDRRAIVGEGRVLVPNDFIVELGERDHQRLAPYEEPLADELGTMVREHADEQGYSFVGPLRITFEQQPDLSTGVFRVRSDVTPAARVEGGVIHRTAPAASAVPAPASPLPGNPRLLVNPDHVGISSVEARGQQRAYPLTTGRVLLGRGPDCDLQVSDPGVSRRHAEVRFERGVFVVADLGSTNGTLVNGTAIGERQLVAGDRIGLGSTVLVFERDDPRTDPR